VQSGVVPFLYVPASYALRAYTAPGSVVGSDSYVVVVLVDIFFLLLFGGWLCRCLR
jgi:hypothetical protein